MLVEAFTEARNPGNPGANEDRFVVLPGRLYAVIDGVSSRTPMRFDGMTSGQFAAHVVQRTLETGSGGDGAAIVQSLSDALAGVHDRFATADAARTDPNLRPATTLALVLDGADAIEIVLIGDSGVRINGTEMYQVGKALDGITAFLRAAAWRIAARSGDDAAACDRRSRAAVMQGLANVQEFPPAELRQIRADAAAACAGEYPTIPAALTAALLDGGILHEQRRHQNNAASPLGYSCLDGTPIPPVLIRHISLPAADVACVELFTDGYFGPGDAFGLAAWERRFAEIEREDPMKIGRHRSVKGSIGGAWSDDRSYVGVRR